MDNNKNKPLGADDKAWLQELLSNSVDDGVVHHSDLTHPDDLELEKILKENWGNGSKEAFSVEEEMPIDIEVSKPRPKTQTPRTTAKKAQQKAAPQKPVQQKPVQQKKPAAKEEKDEGLLVRLPQILTTVVWMLLILAIGVTLGRTLWAICSDVMAFGKDSQQIVITVSEEDDLDAVAKKLADAELIKYPGLFKTFASITGKDENISAGTFTLNAHLDYNAMINAMTFYGPSREEVEIMIPEGYNCKQIFAILEEEGVCTVAELEAYAKDGELSDYWFLEGVTRDNKYCLEGYLFPDTYQFYTNDEPRRVLEKFLNAFDYRFTDLMKEDFENMKDRYARMLASHGYGQDYIDSHTLTIRQVVIIASLIEKETSGAKESYDIASVIYNRLTNAKEHPFLNIDAALVYALDGKKTLTENDKLLDSPYNTYKYQGLVPGPISNPGRDSLYAALDPNDTNYHYYALNPATNTHHFTTNYNEHLNFLNSLG